MWTDWEEFIVKTHISKGPTHKGLAAVSGHVPHLKLIAHKSALLQLVLLPIATITNRTAYASRLLFTKALFEKAHHKIIGDTQLVISMHVHKHISTGWELTYYRTECLFVQFFSGYRFYVRMIARGLTVVRTNICLHAVFRVNEYMCKWLQYGQLTPDVSQPGRHVCMRGRYSNPSYIIFCGSLSNWNLHLIKCSVHSTIALVGSSLVQGS